MTRSAVTILIMDGIPEMTVISSQAMAVMKPVLLKMALDVQVVIMMKVIFVQKNVGMDSMLAY